MQKKKLVINIKIMNGKIRLFIFFFSFINASNTLIKLNIINFFFETTCIKDKNITFPREIWEKILSFNPYDSHPKLFIKIININKTIQTKIKEIIKEYPEESIAFLQNIQKPLRLSLENLDSSLAFNQYENKLQNAQTQVVNYIVREDVKARCNYNASNLKKLDYSAPNLKKLVIEAIESIPLNTTQQSTIKLIREGINTYLYLDNLYCNFEKYVHLNKIHYRVKSNNTNRTSVRLTNYTYFHCNYLPYVLKVLAYTNCFNFFYLKNYLDIFDKNFKISIKTDFLSNVSSLNNHPNNNFFSVSMYPKYKNEVSCFDIETIEKHIDNNDVLLDLSISLLVKYLKKRNCLISDAFIEYFKDPTKKTIYNVVKYEKSLITLQSYIRKYNTESFILNYSNSILTIQSYIRKRACYHQLIQIKTDKAAQTIQNHIRRLIAHKKMNELNAIITIQKYVRKMNSEILLKLAKQEKFHASFFNNLDSISEALSTENLCRQIKILWRIKILFSSVGLLATCFALYKLI